MTEKSKPPAIKSISRQAFSCPVCEENKHIYLFVIRGLPLVRCPGCGLIYTYPQPSIEDINSYYGEWIREQDPRIFYADSETERIAAGYYLDKLRERGVTTGRILLIAPPDHIVAKEAAARGIEIGQHISIQQIESGTDMKGEFDAAIILYQLEKVSLPLQLLIQIRSALKTDGVLLLATLSLDSRSARFFGSLWTGWRPENRFYFTNTTIQSLLWKSGFEQLELEDERRAYTLQHVYDRARFFPKTLITKSIILLYRLLPRVLRGMHLRLVSSGIILTGRRAVKNSRPLCSIVIPVYNEIPTFPVMLEALLAKQLPGMDKEIIVVESNSTDGSRESVLKYRDHPEVKVFLQDRPRGKGNAVREGFQHARGDIILIQDADLEYDLNDYEDLLEPVVSFKAPFILGARHGRSWKMRQFNDRQHLATVVNLVQICFVTLINVLYGQRLKDPFTMYKIFRRDCLHGLKFECNRFDFDHELVIKLVRKGYTPLEIPVNYRSRSFKEGKKIRLFQDGLYGLWADLKYRFVSIGPCKRQ